MGERWREFWAAKFDLLDVAFTLILDGGLIIVALLVRVLLLSVFHRYAPTGTEREWSLRCLEWISNFGLVGAAGLYAVADFLRRLIRVGKELLAELKN